MNNCCLCGQPLYHPDDQTEQAQMQHTVLLYHNRPMSEAHYGCAADHHHDLELDREAGERFEEPDRSDPDPWFHNSNFWDITTGPR